MKCTRFPRPALLFFSLFFCLSISLLHAGENTLDSLENILDSEKEDSNKIKILNKICRYYYNNSDFDKIKETAGKMQSIAEKAGYHKGISDAYIFHGVAYKNLGNYDKAREYYLKALAINEETGDKAGIAACLGNLGTFEYHNASLSSAVEYYLKATLIYNEIRDSAGIANSYRNIANIYFSKTDYDKALEYNFKSLNIFEKINDQRGIGLGYQNIAYVFYVRHNYPEALKYNFKGLAIAEAEGIWQDIANSYDNLGNTYAEMKESDKAIEYYLKALEIDKETENKEGIAVRYSNISTILSDKGDYNKSLEYCFSALKLHEEMGNVSNISKVQINIGENYYKLKNYRDGLLYLNKGIERAKQASEKNLEAEGYHYLSDLYKNTGDFQLAYENYLLYSQLRDSMFNEESGAQIAEMQTKYETEKKDNEILLLNKDKAIANAESKKQRWITVAIAGGLLLAVLFALFIFRSLRVTQRQKHIIEIARDEIVVQKKLVDEKNLHIEEKNKEITDSINYAKRIQYTLLAHDALLKQHLPPYFVLFKPKDIVSGDFYWAIEKNNRFYLAVCDSTGHGVPGAFMSLLNISFLNEAVSGKGIESPDEVFNHCRERLISSLSRDGGQDGMDGTLCSWSTTGRNKNGEYESLKIHYAAANNAPVLISSNQVIVLAADKMPVGKGVKLNTFSPQSLTLKKGDSFYLFSDGYADQFGGPKGKKFKYRQLEELLHSIQDKTMNEQKEILDKTFEQWRGSQEQVDDICIIGIRV